MSRPLPLLGALGTAGSELKAGEIKSASVDGTCTYILDDQPDRTRGPARYLRPGTPTATTSGHTHARPAPPPEGTPCLVVTIGGEFASVWVFPFE